MFGTCKWEMVSNTDPFPDGNFNPSKYLPQCGFPAGQGRKVVCARVFLLETHRFSENSPSKMWGTNMENGYRKLKFLLVAKLKNKLLDALICPDDQDVSATGAGKDSHSDPGDGEFGTGCCS